MTGVQTCALPIFRRLTDRHHGAVVAVSVHSPKFPHTGDHATLVRSVDRLRIDHPVLDDPELIVWQQYGIRGWPTVVVIDPAGQVVGALPGAGRTDVLERVVHDVLVDHRLLGRDLPQAWPQPFANGAALAFALGLTRLMFAR